MNIIILIVLSLSILILFAWQVSNFISIFGGSLYVKSDKSIIHYALNNIEIFKRDKFFELGSGNGDVLIEAQKKGLKACGFEISPYYYILSKIRTLTNPDIKIYFKNIQHIDFKEADVIYCYLLPSLLKELAPKILKSRARTVISIGFPINGLPNEKLLFLKKRKIYFYSLRSRAA